MGIDMFDLTLRLEKSFQIKLDHHWLENVGNYELRDVFAGAIHDYICKQLESKEISVPFSGWHRVQTCIAGVAGVAPARVKRETRLIHDLGFC